MSPILVTIHDLSRAGSGVGRLPDGRIVFVPFTCPGDQALIEIESTDKKYATGKLIELKVASKDRAVPPCPVFGICGGCAWQHIPYAMQWKTKFGGLAHALKRVGVTDIPPVDELPADRIWNYRNRIQLHGHSDAERVEFGFYAPGTKTIVPITECAIARPELNARIPQLHGEIRGTIASVPSYAPRNHKVELEVFPSGEVREYWNAKHAAGGFRQVHDEQNLKLKNWVADNVRSAPGRVLLDLFGGSGNLSLALASEFQEIVCVDLGVPRAPEFSVPENYHFIRQDVPRWLAQHPPSATEKVAIVDPPRIGLGIHFDLMERKFRELNVTRLIAVGCDVDAWAKDVSRWSKRGWKLERLGALDLFPQTPHLECLASFSRG